MVGWLIVCCYCCCYMSVIHQSHRRLSTLLSKEFNKIDVSFLVSVL